ncbi:hypothetical protein P3X46_006145 [Hevea brasiliensis]|uniref:SMP domain-containing protein n=1 Tax=Hevea brasiliensis TaxID=3981 RepID=A0ABQ9MQA0_HEVBR|nr:hypothetical protein P3X46_006145 [Hevea brasiliensis]
MSQGQPQRPQQSGLDQPQGQQGGPGERSRLGQDPIKYGDVFNVFGGLANKIAPEDANMMQTAETMVFGQTQKDAARELGVSVTETDLPGARIITERVAGQVVGQYVEPTPVAGMTAGTVQNAITIGEALEATGQIAGNKPVEQSDAAAIQAAEVRATGSNVIVPGGLAATAQSAASHNAATNRTDDKIKLTDDATSKLPADKVVTRADAEGVVSAELRSNPNLTTYPGGVA